MRIDERVVTLDEGGRPSYLATDLWQDAVPPCSFTARTDGARLVAVATDGFDEASLAAVPAARSAALLRWMRVRARSFAFTDDAAIGLLCASSSDEREGA